MSTFPKSRAVPRLSRWKSTLPEGSTVRKSNGVCAVDALDGSRRRGYLVMTTSASGLLRSSLRIGPKVCMRAFLRLP